MRILCVFILITRLQVYQSTIPLKLLLYASSVPIVPANMSKYDKIYEETFPYVNHTLTTPKLAHLANEKEVFNKYTTYAINQPLYEYNCFCMIGVLSVITSN